MKNFIQLEISKYNDLQDVIANLKEINQELLDVKKDQIIIRETFLGLTNSSLHTLYIFNGTATKSIEYDITKLKEELKQANIKANTNIDNIDFLNSRNILQRIFNTQKKKNNETK